MIPQDENFDHLVFDRNRFLERVMGDSCIARDVAKHAIHDIEQHRAGLIQALETADLEKWHFHAHSLKGVSRVVECRMLADWAEQMHRLAKKHMLEEAHLERKKHDTLFKNATAALRDFHSSL